MTATLQAANDALRASVKARLDATPSDDPKMVGYRGQDEATTARLSAAPRGGSSAFVQLLDEMRRLHESKSADYGSESDPLANIRQGADFVNIEHWRGCMVRIADKVQRLRTYCRTGRLVHEGVRDTLLDLSAYSLLAIVLFDEGQAERS